MHIYLDKNRSVYSCTHDVAVKLLHGRKHWCAALYIPNNLSQARSSPKRS